MLEKNKHLPHLNWFLERLTSTMLSINTGRDVVFPGNGGTTGKTMVMLEGKDGEEGE